MTAKLKIKKGDNVQIIAGKDSGKRGSVLRVLPNEGRVVVDKLNMVKRHTKPRPAPRSSESARAIGRHGAAPGRTRADRRESCRRSRCR